MRCGRSRRGLHVRLCVVWRLHCTMYAPTLHQRSAKEMQDEDDLWGQTADLIRYELACSVIIQFDRNLILLKLTRCSSHFHYNEHHSTLNQEV